MTMSIEQDKRELDAEIERMRAFMDSAEFAEQPQGARDAYLSSLDRTVLLSNDLGERIQRGEA